MSLKPVYDWRNEETGETVEHDSPTVPPSLPGTWRRLWTAPAIGSVKGAGRTPSRPPARG